MGRAMTRRLMLALIALAAVPAHAACKLQLIASVDVELGPAGAVLLPVKVNGHDVWMFLQMSSGISLVNRAVAQQLGLEFQEQRDIQVNTGDGRFNPQVSIVHSMVIGTTNLAGWSLYVQPPSPLPAPMYKGWFVLGPLPAQFVNAADMELDLAHRKVNLFKQTSGCRGQQVYWGGEITEVPLYADPSGLLVFPMEVDGKRVETSLNTQGRRTLISEKVTSQFFGFGRNSPGVTRGPGGADAPGYRAMSLTAKGLSMSDVQVFLRDDLASPCVPTTADRYSRAIGFDECISQAPLSIGTELLQQLRIYLAAKEGRIYFTRVAAGGPATAGAPNGAAAGQGAPAGAAAAAQPGGPASGAPAAGPPAPPAR